MGSCWGLASMTGGGPMAVGMGVGMILWGALLVALVALVVTATRRMLRQGREGSWDGSARSALDLAYARGELDREDYLRRRADLVGGR